MKETKSSKTGRRFFTFAALAAVLVLLNLAAKFLPFRTAYPDVSGSTVYQLSDTSRRYLSGLTEDVEIIYYTEGGRSEADRDLYPFLLQYSDASPRITVKLETISDSSDLANQSIEVRSARRSRTFQVTELYYYYNSSTAMTLSIAEYSKILQMLSETEDSSTYQSLLSIYGPDTITAYFSGDSNLTGAVRYVLADRAPTIFAYSKNVNLNLFLRQQFEQDGCDLQVLQDLSVIPGECEALLLNLAADLTEAEADALSFYLSGGGAVFLTTSYEAGQMPFLAAVLSEYGLSAPGETHLLYDSNSQLFSAVIGDHPVTDYYSGNFVALYAHAIQTTETEGVTHSVLLRTSENAYKITASDTEPEKGSFPLCVAAESGDAKLVWLSMTFDSLSNGVSSGSNFEFAERVLQWMTNTDLSSAHTPASAIPSTVLNVSTSGFIIWIIAFVILIPLALIAIGAVRTYLRKKK